MAGRVARASLVATVDLPTPVAPPISTITGRGDRLARRQARYRSVVSPLSCAISTMAASVVSSSEPIESRPAVAQPLLDGEGKLIGAAAEEAPWP